MTEQPPRINHYERAEYWLRYADGLAANSDATAQEVRDCVAIAGVHAQLAMVAVAAPFVAVTAAELERAQARTGDSGVTA